MVKATLNIQEHTMKLTQRKKKKEKKEEPTKKRQRRTLHNSEGIKRSIQKEIITTINIYAPNI